MYTSYIPQYQYRSISANAHCESGQRRTPEPEFAKKVARSTNRGITALYLVKLFFDENLKENQEHKERNLLRLSEKV